MAQDWDAIPDSITLAASRPLFIARDQSLKSNFSGTTFPTTDLELGMDCFRTDQGRWYRLLSTGPDVWKQVITEDQIGTAAAAVIGTSGNTVPKNNTANTFSETQVFGNATLAINVGANKIGGTPGDLNFGGNQVTLNAVATKDVVLSINNVDKLRVYADGGIVIGGALGASKGNNTLNVNSLYIAGTAVGTVFFRNTGTGADQVPLNSNLGSMSLQAANNVAITGGSITGVSITTPFLHIQDQKAANTAGGTCTAGSWQTRVLNTKLTDEITSTLGSNQFTLPAGTYYCEATAPAFGVTEHQAALYNVTDAAYVLKGSSELSNSGSTNCSIVRGRFTISGTKTFELRHRSQGTRATNGFGFPVNFDSANEIYSDLKIWKVA